jgi:hypothetical protein
MLRTLLNTEERRTDWRPGSMYQWLLEELQRPSAATYSAAELAAGGYTVLQDHARSEIVEVLQLAKF